MAVDFDLDVLDGAIEDADRELTEALGGNPNPAVDLYESLDMQDFNHILGRYGVKPTLEYIQEAERLRAKQTGKS